MQRTLAVVAIAAVTGCGSKPASNPIALKPAVTTEPVRNDPDDPAVWVHPGDPSKSLLLGTNKVRAPEGALAVFNLAGKTIQTIADLDRPNNVDVEYGLPLAGAAADVAVVTERRKHRLRIFRIQPDGSGIVDATSMNNTQLFTDRQGEQTEPMGIALYKRPRDGAVFAIVAPKNGPTDGYLGQYRLEDDGAGRVKSTFVRYFGAYSNSKEIEAVAVDDALGYVYYADESAGIHKYHADPDHPEAAKELAFFGQSGFHSNREGIALYTRPDGTGFIVCTDQIPNASQYRFYKREGEPGRPHDHSVPVKVVMTESDATDGLEISSAPLGPRFPKGLMAAMNSRPRNFLVYDWRDVEAASLTAEK